MSNTHNKKRNSGLLYEFLVRSISSAIVDDDQRKSSKALKILRRHFKQGTELYKELRLVNALIKTTVSSEHVAASILSEAKAAARSHDIEELNKQKSILIKHINYTMPEGFYDQQVSEYRAYATVQTLLNDWRSPSADLSRVAMYEDQMIKWLITPKEPIEESVINEDSTGTARLLMRVMTKKLNEKYSSVLSEGQKALVKAYVFSTVNEDPGLIKKKLQEIRTVVLQKIDEYKSHNNNDNYIVEKLSSVRDQLLSETIEHVNDELITRFMLYIKLNSELCDGGEQ